MAASASAPSVAPLPELRAIAVESLDPADVPVLRIRTDEDVIAWKRTRGYQDYVLFLRRLVMGTYTGAEVGAGAATRPVPGKERGCDGVAAKWCGALAAVGR